MRYPYGSRRLCLTAVLLMAVPATGDVYRWRDPHDGTIHFSDIPAQGAKRIGPARRIPGPRSYRVAEVLDGDTVRLDDGTVVRLIGINAPEVARRGRPGEAGGYDARRRLASRLAGASVRLEPGTETEDRYGRTLAHLFDADGVNINEWLLLQGLAHAEVHVPNERFARAYFRAEEKARKASLGIWKMERFGMFPARDAARWRNSYRRLSGKVTGVAETDGAVELTLDDTLSAIIPKARLDRFLANGRAPASMSGRLVTVRGRIRWRRGTPVIHLRHPLQIESYEYDKNQRKGAMTQRD